MLKLKLFCLALIFSPATFGARLPCFGFDSVLEDRNSQALDDYNRPWIGTMTAILNALGIPPLDSSNHIGPALIPRFFCVITQSNAVTTRRLFSFRAALTGIEACRVAYERSYRMGIPVEPHFLGQVVQALLTQNHIPLHPSLKKGGYFRALDALTFRLRTNHAFYLNFRRRQVDRFILHVHGQDRLSRNTKEFFANILINAPAPQRGPFALAPYTTINQNIRNSFLRLHGRSPAIGFVFSYDGIS